MAIFLQQFLEKYFTVYTKVFHENVNQGSVEPSPATTTLWIPQGLGFCKNINIGRSLQLQYNEACME